MLLEVPYDRELQEGTLIARRDRFLADIRLLNGKKVVCHCYNPGRCEGYILKGLRVWVRPAVAGDTPKVSTNSWLLKEEKEEGEETREDEEQPALLESPSELSPKRKRVTYGTWELVEVNGVMCSVNTVRPNHLVGELLRQRLLPGLDVYDELISEHNLPLHNKDPLLDQVSPKKQVQSRCDFWMDTPSGEHWVVLPQL
jgi:sugar fermentation stimulation protein A